METKATAKRNESKTKIKLNERTDHIGLLTINERNRCGMFDELSASQSLLCIHKTGSRSLSGIGAIEIYKPERE